MMHELAERTMRDLRSGMAEGRIERDPDDDRDIVPDDPDDDRVFFVHFVGGTRVSVCRASAGYFASMLQMKAWVHPCGIPIATSKSPTIRGPTEWVPLLRGQFLLIFEGCQACHEHAGRLADDGNLVSEIKARAKLPPGAYIQPNRPARDRLDGPLWAAGVVASDMGLAVVETRADGIIARAGACLLGLRWPFVRNPFRDSRVRRFKIGAAAAFRVR